MALGNVSDSELSGITTPQPGGESPSFGLFILVAASDLEDSKKNVKDKPEKEKS